MPVPIRVPKDKNIWVAASDGDLARVQELVQGEGLSPNVPDPNTYTPMHAAASYGHINVLEYLIAHGGDVNITDEDDDTPLYVVENIETARYLVDHGAVVNRQNHEGLSPAEALAEDFPEVAEYLETITPTTQSGAPPRAQFTPSQHAQNQASEALTSTLMQQVQDIMQRADAEGRDPEEELREVVGRTVIEGVATGYDLTTQGGEDSREQREADEVKRARTDDPAPS